MIKIWFALIGLLIAGCDHTTDPARPEKRPYSVFQALASVGEYAGAHCFKLRIGADLTRMAEFSVGSRLDTNTVEIPIRASRTCGADLLDLDLSHEVVEGTSSGWTIGLAPAALTLGLPPARSPVDHDGDGDVDLTDWSRFQTCFSGPLNLYPLDPTLECAVFDVDYDLDVDQKDFLAFVGAFTGPLSPPWRNTVTLTVTADAGVPEESFVLIRITGTDRQSGESHDVLAKVTKRSFRLEIAPVNRSDLTTETLSKITAGREVFFDLRVSATGANPDVVQLNPATVGDLPGVTFQTLNKSSQPLTEFLLAPVEFDRSVFFPDGPIPEILWPPWMRQVRLAITLPGNLPVRSTHAFTLQTRGRVGGVTSQVQVQVTKIPALWSPSDLLSNAGRRHLVRAGGPTTFRLLVTNASDQTRTFALSAVPVGSVPQSNFELSADSIPLDPGQEAEVPAVLWADPGSAVGAASDWDVTLSDGQTDLAACRLGAEVTDLRKTIFVDINGLQPEYLYLNSAGTGSGGPGDWLMPNVQEFLTRSANYTVATCNLPAATDINVVNALSGTRTGTAGIPSVIYYYLGCNAHGAAVTTTTDASLLRFGPDGGPVLTAFDVVKQAHPRALTAIVAAKNWIANLFTKASGGVDRVLSGQRWPHYVPPPGPYALGDPPTDRDGEEDPPSRIDFSEWGNQPGRFPEDRWLMHSAMRMIEHEDPDVLYILLANVDEVQHAAGCAWDPGEWDDRGTDSTWDDINRVNPLATREEVLDVVREADHLFGDLIAFLRDRGTLDETYIVLLSDHGMQTETPTTVDPRIVLERAGYAYKDDFDMYGGSGLTLIYEVAPENESAVETLLETAGSIIPSESANPWVVINRSEMQTGLDTFTGLRVAEPGELYSAFYVEHEVPEPIQQRWPSFFLFLLGPWQFEPTLIHRGEKAVQELLFVGGHAGPDTQRIPLVLFGPKVPRGQLFTDPVSVSDIAPTLYNLQGWSPPPSVDGALLPGLVSGP